MTDTMTFILPSLATTKIRTMGICVHGLHWQSTYMYITHCKYMYMYVYGLAAAKLYKPVTYKLGKSV